MMPPDKALSLLKKLLVIKDQHCLGTRDSESKLTEGILLPSPDFPRLGDEDGHLDGAVLHHYQSKRATTVEGEHPK